MKYTSIFLLSMFVLVNPVLADTTKLNLVDPVASSCGSPYDDGLGFVAHVGKEIVASYEGDVVTIMFDVLVLKHTNKILTLYQGIDPSVREGDHVSQGQPIGRAGANTNDIMYFGVRRGFDIVDAPTISKC